MLKRAMQYWSISLRNLVFLILITVIIFFYFAVKSDEFLSSTTSQIEQNDYLSEILDGEEYIQEIHCEEDGLQKISIFFATFGRKNFSTVNLSLEDENRNIIQNWQLDSRLINDNTYYTLALDRRIKDSKGQKYYLKITSDAKAGNGITIYSNSDKGSTGLTLNGKDLGKTICYQLVYRYPLSKLFRNANGFHTTIILLLACILLSTIPAMTKLRIENAFLLCWILVGLLFLFSITLFRVPDETAHFFRAYDVSFRHAVSDIDEKSGSVGNELPLDIDLGLLSSNWQSFSDNKNMEVSEDFVFKGFTNTSLYSPISYLPQALGIFIARKMTSNVASIAYAGRIFNWLFITIILYGAIRLIPVGKEIVALIALMPMNIHESISLAPDGMVVAISILLISAVVYLRQVDSEQIKLRQMFLLYLLAWFISLLKIVYLPFCLLYFLIPFERFGSKQKKILHLTLIALFAIGSNLVWLQVSSNFLLINGTDSSAQLQYLIHNPFYYLLVLARTFFYYSAWWVNTMIGSSLGALDVSTIGILVLVYMCLLAYKFAKQHGKYNKIKLTENMLFGFVVFSIFLLISTSEYLGWTPPYKNIVEGIQGRYFIAILLPLYFAINNPSALLEKYSGKEILSVEVGGFVACINICSCIALLFSCMVLGNL